MKIKIKSLHVLFQLYCLWVFIHANPKNHIQVIIPPNIVEKSDRISKIIIAYFQNKNDSFQISTAKYILDRLKYNYYYDGKRLKEYNVIIKD